MSEDFKFSFDHDRALKRIERNIIFVSAIGFIISISLSLYKMLSFVVGAIISVISFYIIKIFATKLIKSNSKRREGKRDKGTFSQFFLYNMLLFGVIYGNKFIPEKDVFFMTFGFSVVVISVMIEIFYELKLG